VNLNSSLREEFTFARLRSILSLWPAFLILIPLFYLPIPLGLAGWLRNGEVPVFISLFVFLAISYTQISGKHADVARLALILLLFALPLIWVWRQGYSDGNILGGLLPRSDAAGYYWGAQRLLHGNLLHDLPLRRPIFSGFLSFLLLVTGNNLQLTLLLFTMLVGLASFFLANEVKTSYGGWAAAFTLVMIFFFYRYFAGKLLTEQLGLVFGVLGIALLIRGTREYKFHTLFFGFFTLALALNVRAGAFVVLPCLILGGIYWHRTRRRPVATFVFGALIAILCAFAFNYIVFAAIGDSSTAMFSNLSYVLYGLATGNRGWTAILTDHPGVALTNNEIYKLAVTSIVTDPRQLISGIIGAYRDFFDASGIGAFSFLYITNGYFSQLLFLFALLGIINLFENKDRLFSILLLFYIVGILLSVPFLPPIDSDRMRAYAVTVPGLALLCAIGLTRLRAILWRQLQLKEITSSLETTKASKNSSLFVFSFITALVVCMGPLVVRYTSNQPLIKESVDCPANTTPMQIEFSEGSFISLVSEQSEQALQPYLEVSDFKSQLPRFAAYEPIPAQELESLGAGYNLILGTNYLELAENGISFPVFLITDQMPNEFGPFSVCVDTTDHEDLSYYLFYYASDEN
jgi:hypothetical protein